MSTANTLIQLRDIDISSESRFILKKLNFNIYRNQLQALVGESGSGKSITGRLLLGLLPEKIRQSNGTILYDNKAGKISIGYIPQNALNSLNPFFSIRFHMNEAAKASLGRKLTTEELFSLFQKVGLTDSEQQCLELQKKLPNALSGGMKQRVLIAMCLLTKPDLIIADEPTTALDPQLRHLLLQLFKQLIQKENKLSILCISHDLNLLKSYADWISVMYAGVIVEDGQASEIIENSKHPYTKALFNSTPKYRLGASQIIRSPLKKISGSANTSDIALPGCRFYKRCEMAQLACCQPQRWQQKSPSHGYLCELN